MSAKKALYPGSFDPITRGHLDVIDRAAQLFDHLVVGVAVNEAKHPLFTVETRIEMIQESVEHLKNVEVKSMDGLLVEFARQEALDVVVRGLRAISDFEFEFQMALMNRRLHPLLETVFLTPKEDYTFLSSRLVKEVARLGGAIDQFVPVAAAKKLKEAFQ